MLTDEVRRMDNNTALIDWWLKRPGCVNTDAIHPMLVEGFDAGWVAAISAEREARAKVCEIEAAKCDGDGTWMADQLRAEATRMRASATERIAVWQPIATAPRDAIIDVWHKGHGRMTDVWWADESWSSTGTGDDDFSHWMPIPAAP